jgi:hypothetical protein
MSVRVGKLVIIEYGIEENGRSTLWRSGDVALLAFSGGIISPSPPPGHFGAGGIL